MNTFTGKALGSGAIGDEILVLLGNGKTVKCKVATPITGQNVMVVLGSPNLVFGKGGSQTELTKVTEFYKQRPKQSTSVEKFDVCMIYTTRESGYVSCVCPTYGVSGTNCGEYCDVTSAPESTYTSMSDCLIDYTVEDPWVTVGYIQRGYWDIVGAPNIVRGLPYHSGLSATDLCFRGSRWNAGYSQPSSQVLKDDGSGGFDYRVFAIPSATYGDRVLYSDRYYGTAYFTHYYHVPLTFDIADWVSLYDIYPFKDFAETKPLLPPGTRQISYGRTWDFAYNKNSTDPSRRFTEVFFAEVPNTWWREVELDFLIIDNKIYVLDSGDPQFTGMWSIADANIPLHLQRWYYADVIAGKKVQPARIITKQIRNSDDLPAPPISAGGGWSLLWDERGCISPSEPPRVPVRNNNKRVFWARFKNLETPVKILELNYADPYELTCSLGIGNLIYVTVKAGKKEVTYTPPSLYVGEFVEWCTIFQVGSGDPHTVYLGSNPTSPSYYSKNDFWSDRNESFSIAHTPIVNSCAGNFVDSATGQTFKSLHGIHEIPQISIYNLQNQQIYTWQWHEVVGVNSVTATTKTGSPLDVLKKHSVASMRYLVYEATEVTSPSGRTCRINPGNQKSGSVPVNGAVVDAVTIEEDIQLVALFPYPNKS